MYQNSNGHSFKDLKHLKQSRIIQFHDNVAGIRNRSNFHFCFRLVTFFTLLQSVNDLLILSGLFLIPVRGVNTTCKTTRKQAYVHCYLFNTRPELHTTPPPKKKNQVKCQANHILGQSLFDWVGQVQYTQRGKSLSNIAPRHCSS